MGVSMKTSFFFLHMSTMGLLLFIIVFSIRSYANGNASWTNEERDAIRSRQSPLPLQAVVCDSVGVGVVKELSSHQWGETVSMEEKDFFLFFIKCHFSGRKMNREPLGFTTMKGPGFMQHRRTQTCLLLLRTWSFQLK